VKEKRDREGCGAGGGAPGGEGEGIEITRRGIWIPAAALSGLRRTATALLTGALIGSGATLSAMRPGTQDEPPAVVSEAGGGDGTAGDSGQGTGDSLPDHRAPADSPRVCGSAQCACPD